MNYDWNDVLAEVPADRHACVRAQVEAAVAEYQATDAGSAEHRRELWRELARTAKLEGAKKLRNAIRDIGPADPLIPDPGFADPFAPDPDWLPRLEHELAMLPQLATAIADLYKPDERLYSRLFRAWTDSPGVELSISSDGPQTRFLQKILDPLFEDAVDGERLKKAAERERGRRRIFIAAAMKAEGNFQVAAAVTKLGNS
jgi:hypothetical protein